MDKLDFVFLFAVAGLFILGLVVFINWSSNMPDTNYKLKLANGTEVDCGRSMGEKTIYCGKGCLRSTGAFECQGITYSPNEWKSYTTYETKRN